MKKLILTIAACSIFVACGPTQSEAIKYNDHIMALIDGLAVEHSLFLGQIDGHNIDSLQLTHKLFVEKAKTSLDESNKIGPFAEKKEFSDVVHDYFNALNSIANNEGTQMVQLMTKDSAQINQQDLDKINELAAKFDDTYGKAYDKMQEEQLKFSKEWKFELIDTKK